MEIDKLTNLEFIDHYIEECRRFVNPRLLREAQSRGVIRYLDFLPTNVQEAKAVARARLSKDGKFFGDAEIDKIAGEIERLEVLRAELNKLNLANAHDVLPILQKMQSHTIFVRDYFKSN